MKLDKAGPVVVGGVAAALLAVGGCGRREAAAPPREPAQPAARAGAAEPLFFVGRWAAKPELCRDAAWVVTARELHAPGGVSCRLGAPQGAGPVEVDATCAAGGPPKAWRLRFAYAQSARALLVEGGPFADAGLVRCPGGAYPAAEPKPPGSPGGLADDRTPLAEGKLAPNSAQAAANVLQTYFALLETRRFADAWRLWSDGGRASGMSAEAFAASFDDYDSYHAQIGAPGRIEGAAGSLYVDVPVQVYARRKDGREVHRLGTATLRRVNDVPGASAEQLSWRIAALKLGPDAG
jgi:hypothetical protein